MPDNGTPPYAPELDPIESVREYLRAHRRAYTVFDTYDCIVIRQCESWNFLVDNIDVVRSNRYREYAKALKLSRP